VHQRLTLRPRTETSSRGEPSKIGADEAILLKISISRSEYLTIELPTLTDGAASITAATERKSSSSTTDIQVGGVIFHSNSTCSCSHSTEIWACSSPKCGAVLVEQKCGAVLVYLSIQMGTDLTITEKKSKKTSTTMARIKKKIAFTIFAFVSSCCSAAPGYAGCCIYAGCCTGAFSLEKSP